MYYVFLKIILSVPDIKYRHFPKYISLFHKKKFILKDVGFSINKEDRMQYGLLFPTQLITLIIK